MNKSIKKILVSGASLLMLASVGASASNVVSPVHASRITQLEAREKRDYNDIRSIKAQLAKLQHKHVRRHARRHVAKRNRKHAVKRFKHHESVGDWYYHHAVGLWNKYDSNGKRGNGDSVYNTAANDEDNGNPNADWRGYVINTRYMNNPYYRDGWVITYANQNDDSSKPNASKGGTRGEYGKADRIYNHGVSYAKSIHTHRNVQYNPDTNAWKINVPQ